MLFTVRKPIPRKRKKKRTRPPADGREILPDTGPDSEYRARTWEMAKRQGYACAICGRAFTGSDLPSFDHESVRGLGGSNRDDRIEVDAKWRNAAVHFRCNSLKASRRYAWSQDRGGEYREVKR